MFNYNTIEVLSEQEGKGMANYAYLRVSTDAQDVENQKLGVLEYCARREIAPLILIEDKISGGKSCWTLNKPLPCASEKKREKG
jgi:hypothetical protein